MTDNAERLNSNIKAVIYRPLKLTGIDLSFQKPENDHEDEFKDFDQVDDARHSIEANEKKPLDYITGMLTKSELDDASKDLLRRLLEKNPQHRLKSLLGLQRIAFFQHYNFDDVRHLKVRNEFHCSPSAITFALRCARQKKLNTRYELMDGFEKLTFCDF